MMSTSTRPCLVMECYYNFWNEYKTDLGSIKDSLLNPDDSFLDMDAFFVISSSWQQYEIPSCWNPFLFIKKISQVLFTTHEIPSLWNFFSFYKNTLPRSLYKNPKRYSLEISLQPYLTTGIHLSNAHKCLYINIDSQSLFPYIIKLSSSIKKK